MWYTRDVNAPMPDGQLYVNKPPPFPQYPDITYADNGGSHDYHGVTIEAERRFSGGLFFQAAYTAARDLGDTLLWTNAIENPFDLSTDSVHHPSAVHRRCSCSSGGIPFSTSHDSGCPKK
jgi:hypothetical protein